MSPRLGYEIFSILCPSSLLLEISWLRHYVPQFLLNHSTHALAVTSSNILFIAVGVLMILGIFMILIFSKLNQICSNLNHFSTNFAKFAQILTKKIS